MQGQLREAVVAYERSLEINWGRRRVRIKLIKILESLNVQRVKQEQEIPGYISSFVKSLYSALMTLGRSLGTRRFNSAKVRYRIVIFSFFS